MNRAFAGFVTGAVFGLGLTVSGMVNPAKVVGFLDITGDWDPSLALVMLSALVVTFIGYRCVLRRNRPVFAPAFTLPTRQDLDLPLLLGAAIFGVGWGLGGYCPGPALASLGFGKVGTIAFVAAMVVGMMAARHIGTLQTRLKGEAKSA